METAYKKKFDIYFVDSQVNANYVQSRSQNPRNTMSLNRSWSQAPSN